MRAASWWCGMGLLLAACPPPSQTTPYDYKDPSPPVFEWQDGGRRFAVQPYTAWRAYTLHVRNTDGGAYVADQFAPHVSSASVAVTQLRDGEFEFLVRGLQGAAELNLEVSRYVNTTDSSRTVDTYYAPMFEVLGWGGPTSAIYPTQGSLSLAVGESRSVEGAGAWFGDSLSEPLTLHTGDESVATIDAQWRLHGVGIGETTLIYEAGGVTRSVPVSVGDAGLGLVPDFSVTYLSSSSEVEYFEKLEGILPSMTPQGAMAAWAPDGTPVFVADGWGQLSVLLGSWSGTGYGYERVSELWEQATDANVVVDETGRIYVAYFSLTRHAVVVADRRWADAPRTWRYRVLDPGLPDVTAANIDPRRYVVIENFVSLVLRPRPGGGVWLAYADRYDYRAIIDSHGLEGVAPARTLRPESALDATSPCSLRGKFAELDVDTVRSETVWNYEYDALGSHSDCSFFTGESYSRLSRRNQVWLATPDAGIPTVWRFEEPSDAGDGYRAYQPADGGWVELSAAAGPFVLEPLAIPPAFDVAWSLGPRNVSMLLEGQHGTFGLFSDSVLGADQLVAAYVPKPQPLPASGAITGFELPAATGLVGPVMVNASTVAACGRTAVTGCFASEWPQPFSFFSQAPSARPGAIFEYDGQLYGLSPTSALTLTRFALDGGVSEQLTGFATSGQAVSATVIDGGVLFVSVLSGQSVQLLRLGDITQQPGAFDDLHVSVAGAYATYLLPAQTGVVRVTATASGAASQWFNAEGNLSSSQNAGASFNGWAGKPTFDRQGRLLVPILKQFEGWSLEVWRVAPGTASVISSVPGALDIQRPQLFTLADGRVGYVAVRMASNRQRLLVGAVSADDGATFGSEVQLLPERGYQQFLGGLTAQGDHVFILASNLVGPYDDRDVRESLPGTPFVIRWEP